MSEQHNKLSQKKQEKSSVFKMKKSGKRSDNFSNFQSIIEIFKNKLEIRFSRLNSILENKNNLIDRIIECIKHELINAQKKILQFQSKKSILKNFQLKLLVLERLIQQLENILNSLSKTEQSFVRIPQNQYNNISHIDQNELIRSQQQMIQQPNQQENVIIEDLNKADYTFLLNMFQKDRILTNHQITIKSKLNFNIGKYSESLQLLKSVQNPNLQQLKLMGFNELEIAKKNGFDKHGFVGIKYLQKCLQNDNCKFKSQCYSWIAEAYLLKKDFKKMKDNYLEQFKIYQKQGNLDNGYAVFYKIGKNAIQCGQFSSSVQYYKKAIIHNQKLKQQQKMTILSEIISCINQKYKQNQQKYNKLIENCTDMVKLLQKNVKQHSQDLAIYYNMIGFSHDKLHNYAKGIQAYLKAITYNNNLTQVYTNCGQDYYRLKKYQQASDMFKKAIQKDQKDKLAYELLGKCIKQMCTQIDCVQFWMNINPQYYTINMIDSLIKFHENEGNQQQIKQLIRLKKQRNKQSK